FADQAWRSYGIIYAWPLFFYTFFYDPHKIWVVWGVCLTFVVIPVFVLFHGKRYCSWICGCGGLAETFGDRWRHLAPKGKTSIRWEWMSLAILIFASGVTVLLLGKDAYALLARPVGSDGMQYAVRQEAVDSATSSCIGCGVCVPVCPMGTLSFGRASHPSLPMYRESPAAR